MEKFCKLKTFPKGLWEGHDSPKGIVFRPFNYAEQNEYLKICIGPF